MRKALATGAAVAAIVGTTYMILGPKPPAEDNNSQTNQDASKGGTIINVPGDNTGGTIINVPGDNNQIISNPSDLLGMQEDISEIRRRMTTAIMDTLEVPNSNRSAIMELALEFRRGNPDTSTVILEDFVETKSRDLAMLRSRLDDLAESQVDDTRLALVEEARQALDRGDLSEVDSILASAEEFQANVGDERTTALIRTIRGDVAFLGENLSTAALHFNVAIDQLREWAPEEATHVLTRAAYRLLEHGERVGSNGTRLAIELYEKQLEDAYPASSLWAMIQSNICSALVGRSEREGSEEATNSLEQAVEACRSALPVLNGQDDRENWATAQNNLGNALLALAKRRGDSEQERERLLNEAVAAYLAAMDVYIETESEEDLAGTLINLSNAWATLGAMKRTSGHDVANSDALLVQATRGYEGALTVYTQDRHPSLWALLQQNLGTILHVQDEYLLAIRTYLYALEVYTEDQYPVEWAETTAKMGAAMVRYGTESGADRQDFQTAVDYFSYAIEAFQRALTVQTREGYPVKWATTNKELAYAFEGIAIFDADRAVAHYRDALKCIQHALEVFDDRMLAQYSEALASEGRIREHLVRRCGNSDECEDILNGEAR